MPLKPVSTLLLTAILLASCNSATPSSTPDTTVDHPGQVAPRYDLLAAVDVKPGDTAAALQSASGGTIVGWKEAGCDTGSCRAMIGLSVPAGQPAPTEATLSARLNRPVAIEANKDQFGGGGAITAVMGGTRVTWAGGHLQEWASGTRVTWAGGTYSPIPQNTQTWNAIHLQQAQALAPNLGAGVVVAVIDTGLDLNHAAFAGALTDPSTWRDYYGGDGVPQDEGTLGTGGYGHGTNVAGIILQIAPKARIMPIRVLGPDGSGDVANVVSAINWAVAHGANIINLSLGSTTRVDSVDKALLSAAAKDVLAVSSGGNANAKTLTYPAQNGYTMPLLISVSSVDLTGAKSGFSNYGYMTEVVAPGENVFAPAPGNMMASWSGTSQAAPMVAGGMALAMGQTLKVPVAAIPGAVSYSADNAIYNNSVNWSYGGQLGSGELDLLSLVKNTVK